MDVWLVDIWRDIIISYYKVLLLSETCYTFKFRSV